MTTTTWIIIIICIILGNWAKRFLTNLSDSAWDAITEKLVSVMITASLSIGILLIVCLALVIEEALFGQ